ncbi:hypothetical protein [Marinifilum sp. D714]|uniref:hypothetical protein n=1 Tax=Marinifilum sp. D714 TaxID=2937523 RepID=UPI0027C39A36|nr:hypothetical protein [Marinifilum sp. D714]MDQ2180390.1 hypothetical protein [Marinifilum sp. D714]
MKKIIIALTFMMGSMASFGQIFDSSDILKKGELVVACEPGVFIFDGSEDFRTFFHGEYGLGKKMDLGVSIDPLNRDGYYGADLELWLAEKFSMSVGAHHFSKMALDAAVKYSTPIRSNIKFTSGLDGDYFINKSRVALWLPVGVDMEIGNGLSVLVEAKIEITDEAYNYLGIGVAYKLK